MTNSNDINNINSAQSGINNSADNAHGQDGRATFGFILFGGPLSGAMVRDIRLANELATRGYKVHIWWAMDRNNTLKIDDSITQHWLFHGLRYLRMDSFLDGKFLEVREFLGQTISKLYKDEKREHFLQKRQHVLKGTIQGLLEQVKDGVDKDKKLVQRFAKQLDEAKVTHVLPMLAALCPFVQAARKLTKQNIEYLVTFQGYELYLNYARMLGFEKDIHKLFIESVDESGKNAIAVSEDYCQRVVDDIGIDPSKLTAIPPGVPGAEYDSNAPIEQNRNAAIEKVRQAWAKRNWTPDKPTFTYVGRRDSEKGLDLLLYAGALVKERGIDVQIVIAGPTLFGKEYSKVIEEIAENLRIKIFWSSKISDEFRSDLFAASTAVVYPSIHREPFGMVPVEAIAHGTPAIVPNYGGVANTIEAEGKLAGIRFEKWDTYSLASAMIDMISDKEKWQQLSENGPLVADYYSIKNLGSRVLKHLGIES